MKRITLVILAVAALIAGSVSCQKVNDLDKRLTKLEETVSDLKAQVTAGAVITSVEKTDDGCTFVLSNGQSYTVTDGTNGTDGEAIIADVKVEDDFVVLALKGGEILRISYQNPLLMVTLSIVPDFDDGTVIEPKTMEMMGMKSNFFYLNIAVTPAKYAEILSDTERFIHKAVFSSVLTKSDFGNAFTVSPSRVSYLAGAPIPFLEAYFELDDETAAVLMNKNSAYTVSYSIEDKDGVHGAATAFVAISNVKGSGGDGPTANVVPDGALPGVFTVKAATETEPAKKVHFYKGNLWADGSNVLHFEDAQWESTPTSDGPKNSDHVSHFTWSSTVENAVAGNDGDCFFCDESHKQSVDGSKAIYYALSTAEWQYLINKNGAQNIRKDKYQYGVTVCGKMNCVVLLPDGWAWDENTVGGTWQSVYPETSTEESPVTWKKMEDAGAVCLPAAGGCVGSNVRTVGGRGYYWSSSVDVSNTAYAVYFDSDLVRPDYDGIRNLGFSVRLITEYQ